MTLTDQLVARNRGYINPELQNRLENVRVLFAGCGLGSVPAEASVRLGVKNITLVDQDHVELHNLNRQAYTLGDIGKPKVEALRDRLLQINSDANISAVNEFVSPKNVQTLVANADFIIDTIDFLDLKNIVSLHDAAYNLKKPLFSLFTAGWGAVGIFIPVENRPRAWVRDLFELGDSDASQGSYVKSFFEVFGKLSSQLDPAVQKDMAAVMDSMKDGKHCPASHVIGGSACASALSMKILTAYLDSKPIPSAPKFININLNELISEHTISI